jgi:hypothetical protein
MSTDRINGEQLNTIEWGSRSPASERLEWLTTDRPVIRGAGIGCALAGFGLLIAAEMLPWMSTPTTSVQQDFPTATGGRIEVGIVQLAFPTEIVNLGWLVILATVAVALAVRPPVRRIVVAAGLGLVAGQFAMLVGITRGILRTTNSAVFRGGFIQTTDVPVQLEIGLYAAYAAAALLALALLLASGLPRRLRDPDLRVGEADPVGTGPVDLTVTALPATDPTVWSRREADIDVGGRHLDR